MAKLTARPTGPVLGRAGGVVLAGSLLVSACGADATSQSEPQTPLDQHPASATPSTTESAPQEPEATQAEEHVEGGSDPSTANQPGGEDGEAAVAPGDEVGDEFLYMPYRR